MIGVMWCAWEREFQILAGGELASRLHSACHRPGNQARKWMLPNLINDSYQLNNGEWESTETAG